MTHDDLAQRRDLPKRAMALLLAGGRGCDITLVTGPMLARRRSP